MNDDVYVNIDEFATVIFNFINSDEYKKILNSIQDGTENGFITGLMISCTLMNAKCKKYFKTIEVIEDTVENE